MSHHLDSELARKDPRLDISDVYVFRGNDGTVLVMNVNPQSGKGGFHDEARYQFNVDTSGNYKANVIFRLTFSPHTPGKSQDVTFEQLNGGRIKGQKTQGKTGKTIRTKNGIKFFAGQAGEPFYIAGPVVAGAKEAIATGEPIDLGDFDPTKSENLFGNTNVHSIVIEIPDSFFGTSVIGVWGTVELATDAGGWRQVQRAAKPLINTLYSFGKNKDYNASQPHQDESLYGQTVKKLTAQVTDAMGSALNPKRHAERVALDIFPDVLEYNIGTTASFIHRNGRNLADPDAENMINFVLNKQIPMGLDTSDATGKLRKTFPYISKPI